MTPAKRLATAVLDIVPNPDIRGLAQCYELAHQILRKRPASPAAKYKPQLDTKPARKRWKAAETAEIWARVMKRADGRCERCAWVTSPFELHLHHLLPGSGRRLQQQSYKTTVALCVSCHNYLHAHPEIAGVFAQECMKP